MRGLALIAFSTAGSICSAQLLVGTYSDWFGQQLTLRADSSFEYDYHFDLIADRSQGTWSTAGDTLVLRYLDVLDVHVMIDSIPILRQGELHRVAYPRFTMVPSLDNKIDTIQGNYEAICCPGSGMRPTRLLQTKDKLYLVTETGTVVRGKGRNIYGKRVPSYFQRRSDRTSNVPKRDL
jgi:hypothetical protein